MQKDLTVIPANAAGAQKVERLSSVVFTKVVLESIEEAGVKKKKNPCPKSFQAARRLIKTPDEREQNKTQPTCWPGGGWREGGGGPSSRSRVEKKIQAASAGARLRRKHQQETRGAV